MKQRKLTGRILGVTVAAALLVGGALSGCSSTQQEVVPVQSVAMLLGLDLSGNNSFTGVVESRTTQKVARDNSKTVGTCYVAVGDMVTEGDLLFDYDLDALSLSIESTKLEIDQLNNSITGYDTQIAQLEKEKQSASKNDQLSYTLQIQTAQKDQAEAQYNLKQKEADLVKLEESMTETAVYAEISGVVQGISEEDPAAYITILETEAYQVKGSASELNVYNLYSGEPVTIRSRTTEDTWSGTIREVNTGSTETESENQSYDYGNSSGESASKYSFYVDLDSSENLMMGQHVYILPYDGMVQEGIWLYSSYLIQEDEGNTYVWAVDSNDRLEKRTVTLGDYDEDLDSYQIVSGLSEEDYIAVPGDSCTVGAEVTYYDESSFGDGDSFYAVDDNAYLDEGYIGDFDEEYYGEEFYGEEFYDDAEFEGSEDYLIDDMGISEEYSVEEEEAVG